MLRLRESGLEWRQVDDEIVVLDVRTSVYFALNGSAARLWTRLSEGTTRGELVQRLVEEYEIDAGQAEADVAAFLENVEQQGFLESD